MPNLCIMYDGSETAIQTDKKYPYKIQPGQETPRKVSV